MQTITSAHSVAPLAPTALAHQVVFQGSAADAERAWDHYLARLGAAVESKTILHTQPTFAAQARLHVDGVGAAVLSLSAPSNPADHDAFSYVASLTIVEPAGDERAAAMLFRDLELLPLTELELTTVRRQFPLTQTLAATFGPTALAGYACLMAIHHITDFVAMMDALTGMGVDPANVTILDKGYPYTQRHRVDAWLRDTLGMHVDLYPDRVRVVGEHIKRAREAGLKTLIFDDGGHLWPIVVEHYPESVGEFIGVVEQTMSGIWKLDGVPLPVPVFSVAESQLKATMESYGVALAGVRSFLDRLPNEKWEGRPALVVGYGRIGRQIAHVLRTMRMRVAVYDKEIVQLVAAHEEGFTTSDSLVELIETHEPLLLFGTAGRRSLTGEHIAAFRNSCYLVSVTSRTYEFDLDAIAQQADGVHDFGKLGHGYQIGDHQLCVVGHGMPINFYFAQSLPNRYIDLIVSSLLLGGVTLASPGQGGFRPGHNLDLTNKVLNTSPALATYYATYAKPGAPRDLLTPGTTAPPFAAVPWTFPPAL